MKGLVWGVLLLVVGNASGAQGAEVKPRQDVLTAGPAVLFRDYAMASCLAQAFPAISREAGSAASGYVQYGNAGTEAYEAATKLAGTFVARDYPSINGSDLGVMKCIDLAHSRELDALVLKYYPRRRGR